ncbi:beta-1,4-N-acetylgalactosaminyltransferase bre-4-like [Mizuhopecten yessoensis]|uniref:beta-1,4-N-acetylgalactosaminyltransferase bre-4-like n=1 Tax=Mizuhopecten yessoensis TaxID=6573 RepID=UPI000B45D578|nr:beta-1,4-N-acetylgalactosaminyltransferase bre-4-like [Mizuhopecten yessoensis]
MQGTPGADKTAGGRSPTATPSGIERTGRRLPTEASADNMAGLFNIPMGMLGHLLSHHKLGEKAAPCPLVTVVTGTEPKPSPTSTDKTQNGGGGPVTGLLQRARPISRTLRVGDGSLINDPQDSAFEREKSPPQIGCLRTYQQGPPLKDLETMLDHLNPGGRYAPLMCETSQRVALVIPYRNRELQLRTVLYNLHLMLRTQQLDYVIFLVEQAGSNTFNRGMLMNIGYAEAIKTYNYTCFVFHDVDLIPEDDRIYYGCGTNVRHLSVAIDKFNYRIVFPNLIGGVTQLPRAAFEKINGFSNLYFGWGGEDDDLGIRIRNAKLIVERQSIAIARYRMIKHLHERSNAPNPKRFQLLRNTTRRIKNDGLNTLKYRVLHKKEEKLYANITVEIKKEDYNL